MSGFSRANSFLSRHLAEVPLHRAILRSAECQLFSTIEWQRPILDVGCGDGLFAAMLFDQPLEAGIDRSPKAIAEAHRRASHLQLAIASACQIPYPASSFASVMSNCVLEHIPQVDAALAEINRVLIKGGSFTLTVPSENFGRFLLGTRLFQTLHLPPLARLYSLWMNQISHHYHCYPPAVWISKLQDSGFAIERFQYYFSEKATHLFDLCHYLSTPSLLTRMLLGRWVLFPGRRRLLPWEKWLGPYSSGDEVPAGAYIFFACRKPK